MAAKRSVHPLLTLAAIIVIGAGLKFASAFVVPLLLASFIAIVTAPIVMWLCDRAVPRLAAVTIGLLLDIAAGAALGVPLVIAATTFASRLPSYEARLLERMQTLTRWLESHGRNAESLMDLADPNVVINLATGLAQTAAGLVSQMVLVLLVVAFMLFESTGIREKMSRISRNKEMFKILAGAMREVNKYLVAKTVMSLFTGIVIYFWCLYCDLDVPLLWALLAYVLNFIPNIGQIIAAIPAIVLAMVQFGLGHSLFVAAGYLSVNVLLGIVEPRVMGGALGLSTLVVFVSMIVWGWLLGPVGALLSAPITMIIKHMLEHDPDTRWMAQLLSPAANPASLGGALEDRRSII